MTQKIITLVKTKAVVISVKRIVNAEKVFSTPSRQALEILKLLASRDNSNEQSLVAFLIL